MKKILFIASYVLALFTVWSCSNDQEVLTNAETPVEPTYNKTLADLEAYNCLEKCQHASSQEKVLQ